MKIIGFDFETHLISETQPVPKPICLSFYDGTNTGLLAGKDMEVFLFEVLCGNDIIVCHNFSFEGNVIDTYYPELREPMQAKLERKEIVCTQIYEQLLNNSRKNMIHRFDLASLVKNYFGKDISDTKKDPDAWRLRYSELENVAIKDYPPEAAQYAIDDSIWAYKVYQKQIEIPTDINDSVKAAYYLNKMGAVGIKVKPDRVLDLKQQLINNLKPSYKVLIEAGLCVRDKKTGKVKKKMKLLREYIKENIPEIEHTPKGTVSTSGESLERYNAIHNDLYISKFLDIGKYEKILSAFISRLEGADVIRTQYNAVVSSGRTSSRTSKFYPSVNIQQMPRGVENVSWDVRNCFISRPGYKIVSIDYNGLELASCAHQLAIYTGMTNMKDLINSGDVPIDMHSMFACKLKTIKDKKFCSYTDFVKNKKLPGYKEYRLLAKPINLGFPGGIGYDNMRSILIQSGVYPKLEILNKSTSEEALVGQRNKFRSEGYPVRIRRVGFREFQLIYDELVEIKDSMFNLYPDLEQFLKHSHLTRTTGYNKRVKNNFEEWESEPMYSYSAGGFNRDWCMYTQICNGLLMQSPAAIGAKRAMCAIIKKYGNSKSCIPLAFIHDEILMEVLDNDNRECIIEDVSNILIEEMQTVLTSVRIAVEAEVCGDYWKKEGGDWTKTYWRDK